MPLVNYLPRRAREWVYSIGGMTEAVSQREVGKLNFDDIAEWITSLLPKRSYPGVFIGSSNGALVHLAAALAIPWLPQTFLCPVRDALSDPDDARAPQPFGEQRDLEAFRDLRRGLRRQRHDA